MAGLAQRSRPILGGGNYLLPLEFKLHSKIKEFGKDRGLIKLNEFPLSSSIVSANVDVLIPIIRGDFKLNSKVSQSKEDGEYLFFASNTDFEMKPKISNEVRENLAALIGNIGLKSKVSQDNTDARLSAIKSKLNLASLEIVEPLTNIDTQVFISHGYVSNELELRGGVLNIPDILASTDETWLRLDTEGTLVLEFNFTQPVNISGFATMCSLPNNYSDNGVRSITIEDKANSAVIFEGSLPRTQKYPVIRLSTQSATTNYLQVTFKGFYSNEVNLQYFNFF